MTVTELRAPGALLAALTLIILSVDSAGAQQRPLATEDPEPVGAGRILIESGMDYQRGIRFPVSGLEGKLLRAPLLGVSIGVSSIAEIQIDGGLYNRLQITGRRAGPLAHVVTPTGHATRSIEDLVIGTKVRLVPEGVSRPSFGLRIATKLPNASNESGLGLDTTDFFASLLVAKAVDSVRVAGNVGLGILGDPTRGDRQNDVLTYGLSLSGAVSRAAEVVGEINGHANTRSGVPPPGTASRGAIRLGARYTIGAWRTDAAILVGLTDRDAGFGVAAGLTYVFDAFQVP